MKNHVTKIAFIGMILLPMALFVLLPYLGADISNAGSPITEASFLDLSEQQLEIVYFGYAGCSFICPTALFSLGEALDSLAQRDQEVGLHAFFVDINAETQILRAHEYSSAFSPRITGVNTDTKSLNGLKDQFGLNSMTGVEIGDEILHPDIFFVVKRSPRGWQVVQQISGTTDRDKLIEILTYILESSST